MLIEEMKKIGSLRKGGTSRQFEDWVVCASDNWDKLMAVVEAAKAFIEFDTDSDDHDRLEYALKALEQE